VELTNDGGFIFTGYRGPYWVSNFYLMKCDAVGDSVWAYDIPIGFSSTAYSVIQTFEGNYIAVGWTEFYLNDTYTIIIAGVGDNGDSLWTRIYGFGGPSGESFDRAFCISESDDNNYVVSGKTYRNGISACLLMKLDTYGDTIWTRDYHEPGSEDMYARSVDLAFDGGFIMAGHSGSFNSSDWLIIRTDSDGNTIWTINYGDSIPDDFAYSIAQVSDGGYIVVGVSNYDNNGSDCVLMKIESDHTKIREIGDPKLPEKYLLTQNYPNPFNTSTTFEYGLFEMGHVKINIYDLLGRTIETLIDDEMQAGHHQIIWDASNNSSGIYFYRMEAGDLKQTKKMILLK